MILGVAGASAYYYGLAGGIAGGLAMLTLDVVWFHFADASQSKRLRVHLERFSETYDGPTNPLDLNLGAIALIGHGISNLAHSGMDARGVHVFRGGRFTVPWEFVDSIVLVSYRNLLSARLYLRRGELRDNSLLVAWKDSYRPFIPDFVRVENMRERSQEAEEQMP